MNEERSASMADQPQGESRIKKYLRYGVIAFFLLFFAAIIVGAIARKMGG